MKIVALVVLAVTLTGCAAAIRSSGGKGGVVGDLQDARQLDLLFSELETEEAALTEQLASFQRRGNEPVDCPRACDLRASIANLARRICAVTKGLADQERQIQCVDARRRSEIAKASVKEVCECTK